MVAKFKGAAGIPLGGIARLYQGYPDLVELDGQTFLRSGYIATEGFDGSLPSDPGRVWTRTRQWSGATSTSGNFQCMSSSGTLLLSASIGGSSFIKLKSDDGGRTFSNWTGGNTLPTGTSTGINLITDDLDGWFAIWWGPSTNAYFSNGNNATSFDDVTANFPPFGGTASGFAGDYNPNSNCWLLIAGNTMLRSTNGFASLTNQSASITGLSSNPVAIGIKSDKNSTWVAIFRDSSNSTKFFRSTSSIGNGAWANVYNGPTGISGLETDRQDTLVAFGSSGVFYSGDKGLNWQKVSDEVITSLKFLNGTWVGVNGNRVFISQNLEQGFSAVTQPHNLGNLAASDETIASVGLDAVYIIDSQGGVGANTSYAVDYMRIL